MERRKLGPAGRFWRIQGGYKGMVFRSITEHVRPETNGPGSNRNEKIGSLLLFVVERGQT